MKKTLLFLCVCLIGGTSFAQVLTENFSGYTIGNIGTDMTGTTPGQGNWYTLSSNGTAPTTTTNASNNNFQIVDNGGTNGYVLQITGPNGNPGSSIMWQNGLSTWWGLRPAGNNIIEIEYDFFTGPPTTSLNNMRVLLYDAAGTRILAGLSMVESTKVISGVAYYDNTAGGGSVTNYLFNLGTPPVTLPANTWVRMGMSFNKTTGEVKWRGPGFNGFVMGAAAGYDPDEADLIATAGGAANNVASTGLFDNLLIRNTATDTLLEVDGIQSSASMSVFPNPASGFINIANVPGLRSIAIVDLNGRTVKSVRYEGVSDATVDISELAAGMYLLSVNGDSGTVTQKIVKK
ncbi:MAG TPA: T9SS type A sorting domain-containing protein [Flavobacterium sp.]